MPSTPARGALTPRHAPLPPALPCPPPRAAPSRARRLLLGALCLGSASALSPGCARDPAQLLARLRDEPPASLDPTSGADPRGLAAEAADLAAPPEARLSPLDPEGAGGSIVVARLEGARGPRRLVFAADADGRRLVALDPERREGLARVDLRGAPSAIAIGPDGRLYAALRDRAEVAVLEATGAPNGALVERAALETESEPVALAVQHDPLGERGARLLVVSGWGHHLEAFDLATRRRVLRVDLPREPRGIALSADGRIAFVSHMVGSVMSAVDLEAGSARAIPLPGADLGESHDLSCAPAMAAGDLTGAGPPPVRSTRRSSLQGFALVRLDERIFAPEVLVRTGDPRSRTGGYGEVIADLPSHLPAVAVVGAASGKPTLASLHVDAAAASSALRRRSCLLPRAAAADPSRRSLFVACLDLDVVLELDADRPDPARAEKRRYVVAPGPTGIALDAAHGEGFVWSQFDRTINVLHLEPASAPPMKRGARVAAQVSLAEDEDPGDSRWEMGRWLFHHSNEPGIARDGRACASCHPDGRDDGLTWPTPLGPRQPPMLAGRLRGSAPYSWAGDHATLRDHVTKTFGQLGGKGLAKSALDALLVYVEALPEPPRRPADGALAARGGEVFHSVEVGCATCHREGPAWTDGSLHDVGSSAPADRFSTFDTPSLRFVGGTAPYFHDGRFATLRELLAATDGKMGSTRQLGEGDLQALEAYLHSL